MAGWAGCDWAFPSNIPARLISPKLQQIKISNKLLKSINKVNRRRMQPKPTKNGYFPRGLGGGRGHFYSKNVIADFLSYQRPNQSNMYKIVNVNLIQKLCNIFCHNEGGKIKSYLENLRNFIHILRDKGFPNG